jgi:predicted lipoprotein with Yx(FWY)xxD motif
MRSRTLTATAFLFAAVALVGCTGGGATTAPTTAPTQAPASQAPASQAPASEAPASEAPASAATGGATVEAKPVGAIGTVLVAGSTGMTVYTFSKDTKDSGTSACSGDCLTKWPALTVPAGGSPTAGDGVTGKLATITRADDGTLQVVYNGLPLYFFSGDSAPGDANGVYPNWAAVKP